jgi:hypothetical protein
MKELTNRDLLAITQANSAPMLSIYLSRDSSLDMRTLSEKWKDSLSKAENLLLKDYPKSFVHTFIEPIRLAPFIETLDHLNKGVIVFHGKDLSGHYRVHEEINDLVVVADSFHIKPLLRIKNNEEGFVLIAISSKAIAVWLESNGQLYRMDTIENTAQTEDPDTNKSKPEVKDFLAKTAAEINKSIAFYKAPVLLAGVKEHIGHMKKFLNHPNLLNDFIIGNVERMKVEDLRERCLDLLIPYYQLKENKAIYELNQAVKRNQAITYIEDIAVSAVYGKIKKIFVIENRQVWGRIDKNSGEIFISPKQTDSHDDDILDDVCQLVLAKGGEVVVLKNADSVKGCVAAAIVTDKSHLYDFSGSYSISI